MCFTDLVALPSPLAQYISTDISIDKKPLFFIKKGAALKKIMKGAVSQRRGQGRVKLLWGKAKQGPKNNQGCAQNPGGHYGVCNHPEIKFYETKTKTIQQN